MKWLTITEVQERLRIAEPDTVLKLINRNILKAVNISASPGRRTLRISEDSLNEFIAARTVTPAPSPARRRRKSQAETIPEYV